MSAGFAVDLGEALVDFLPVAIFALFASENKLRSACNWCRLRQRIIPRRLKAR